MGISPEYLGLLRASINSSPEWKQAWERTNDYLDALRIPADLEGELLLLTSFERAIARKRKEPSVSATELAFDEAQKALDATLGDLISAKVPADRRSVEERVRLYLMQPTQNSVLSPRNRFSNDVLDATLGDLISAKVPADRRSVEERVRLYLMQPTQNSVLSPRNRLSNDVLE